MKSAQNLITNKTQSTRARAERRQIAKSTWFKMYQDEAHPEECQEGLPTKHTNDMSMWEVPTRRLQNNGLHKSLLKVHQMQIGIENYHSDGLCSNSQKPETINDFPDDLRSIVLKDDDGSTWPPTCWLQNWKSRQQGKAKAAEEPDISNIHIYI